MSGEFLWYTVTLLTKIAPFIIGAAELAIGILITVSRVRSARILGVRFIILSISLVISGFYEIMFHFMISQELMNWNIAKTVLYLVFLSAASLCICIYIHKNYGKKFIYLPVMIIPVAGWFISRVVVLLISKIQGQIHNFGVWANLTSVLCEIIFSSVVSVILITIFWKNREKENVIPNAWLILLVTFILDLINKGCDVLLNAGLAVESFSESLFNSYMLIQNLEMLEGLIFPIYILVCVAKASKQLKEQTIN